MRGNGIGKERKKKNSHPDEIKATKISLGRPWLNTLRCSSKFNGAGRLTQTHADGEGIRDRRWEAERV